MTVTVERDRKQAVEEIAEALRHQGLSVNNLSARAGAIFGTAAEADVEAIRAVSGVRDVRPEGTYQLKPFTERVPQ
ncbi:hypothetical protein VQ042_18850 [Aurantimonas sp. A2-1-M11]|uniref:hypothetical protein n=1 Tax=Aurantimonas sp. A2-1-M11 TaxID=3113712 RepID=UPI002F93B097